MSERHTIFITGSTSGLGLAAATRLLRDGHRVILHGRDAPRAAAVAAEVATAVGRAPDVVTGDLGSFASVRAIAAELTERFETLDVLVNNAAISNWGRGERMETVDGHEQIFATNYLSHYLLTRALLPHLLRSPASRVISVGARQMGAAIDFDDLDMKRRYDAMQAVLRAKLGLFALTRALAARHARDGLRAACLDPGLARTGYQSQANPLMKVALSLLAKRPEQVAELYRWLATSGDVAPEGRLYSAPSKPVRWQPWVLDDRNVARLWDESARLVGAPTSVAAPSGAR